MEPYICITQTAIAALTNRLCLSFELNLYAISIVILCLHFVQLLSVTIDHIQKIIQVECQENYASVSH